MSDTLLVTGAGGQLGRRVIHHLLETRKVPAANIVAATRDTTKLQDVASKGVVVRKADFDDPASLDSAFAGVDRLLIISTDAVGVPGKRIMQHEAAVSAAARAGVKRIFYTSMPNPEPGSPILFAGDHYGTEQAIKATGLPYTIFRNGWYMENLFMSLPQVIATGQWYTSAGDGRIAHVAREDVAKAIAGGLVDTTGESLTYTLTGQRSFTTDEIAGQLSEVMGKPIAVAHLTDEQLAAGMAAAGVPAPVIPLFVSFDTNTRAGRIDMVTDAVARLSSAEPTTLRSFLEASKARLGV